MSWVSENKFLAGFGAVMLAGVGTLGWFTYSAMGKYETATGEYDGAYSELTRLHTQKPSLSDAHLQELLAQKKEMTEKIGAFQITLKSRVLPVVTGITPAQFQDKLKNTVAQITANATAARIERPKDFYLGFGEYQAKPPDDKATAALARELHAIELVMDVLIKTAKTDNIELNDFHRDPLPDEGRAKADNSGRKRDNTDRSERNGPIERNGIQIKMTSSDEALRKVLAGLANHKQQLFVVRNVIVQNKLQDSPPRVGGAQPFTPAPDQPADPGATVPPPSAPPTVPPPGGAAAAPATPATPTPATPGAPAPAAPVAPIASGLDGPLAYVFGTEKITSTIEIEILNIEEPKSKPDKSDKKKEKGK